MFTQIKQVSNIMTAVSKQYERFIPILNNRTMTQAHYFTRVRN